jgi:hypothetical protein
VSVEHVDELGGLDLCDERVLRVLPLIEAADDGVDLATEAGLGSAR